MLSYRAALNQPQVAPYPYLWVRITDEIKNLHFGPFGAIIDSGADYTCIPRSITDLVVGYDYDDEIATDFDGNIVSVDMVRIRLGAVELMDQQGNLLVKKRFQNLKMPIVGAEGLLGRDILNATICNLDGPTLVCSLK